jgi:hypothetical protein
VVNCLLLYGPHSIVPWLVLNLSQSQSRHHRWNVHRETASQTLLQSVPPPYGVVRRSGPSFNGSFLGRLLFIGAPERHPVAMGFQHRVQVVETSEVIAEFGFADPHDKGRRVKRLVAVSLVLRSSARSLQNPRLLARSLSPRTHFCLLAVGTVNHRIFLSRPSSMPGPAIALPASPGTRWVRWSVVDWAGWAIFGFVGTVVLTGVIVFAQLVGWTRMDLPLMLGTMFMSNIDRARVLGVFLHLASGQGFALVYAVVFWRLDRSGAVLGAAFGLIHGLAALTLIVPFLPAVHPRMSSERSGPEIDESLEPPGLFGLNFGSSTPIVTLIAHVLFGLTLGVLLKPG